MDHVSGHVIRGVCSLFGDLPKPADRDVMVLLLSTPKGLNTAIWETFSMLH